MNDFLRFVGFVSLILLLCFGVGFTIKAVVDMKCAYNVKTNTYDMVKSEVIVRRLRSKNNKKYAYLYLNSGHTDIGWVTCLNKEIKCEIGKKYICNVKYYLDNVCKIDYKCKEIKENKQK